VGVEAPPLSQQLASARLLDQRIHPHTHSYVAAPFQSEGVDAIFFVWYLVFGIAGFENDRFHHRANDTCHGQRARGDEDIVRGRRTDFAGTKGGGEEMRTYALTALAALGFVLLGYTAFAAMQEGVRLEADGEVIDVEIGHLVPYATDWNADGKKDLIVGQFSGGRIRLYLNQGTDKAPVFKAFTYLSAGGQEIRLPAG